MLSSAPSSTAHRHALIAQARQTLLADGAAPLRAEVEPWIARSWQRCLAQGMDPTQRVVFEAVSAPALRHSLEQNQALLRAARPVLEQLTRAIAGMRYFAILTDARGTVVDVQGHCDPSDPRASSIGRVGIDLSEAAVGTTAISAALTELQPVWLHRGEHFFQDTGVYSCAGAPVFGPDGLCAGMLDLTGIETTERPALKHLVRRSARSIENSWLLSNAHALVLRLNWPGNQPGDDSDGLLTLDTDGLTPPEATARLTQLLAAAALSVVICIALWQSRGAVDAKGVTVGGFAAFITAMLMLIAPIRRLADVASPITRGVRSASSTLRFSAKRFSRSVSRYRLSFRMSGSTLRLLGSITMRRSSALSSRTSSRIGSFLSAINCAICSISLPLATP